MKKLMMVSMAMIIAISTINAAPKNGEKQARKDAKLDTKESLFFDHHDGEVAKIFMGWRGLV